MWFKFTVQVKYLIKSAFRTSRDLPSSCNLTSFSLLIHDLQSSNGFTFGLTGASSQSSGDAARDTPEDLSVTKDDDDDDDGDDDSDKLNDSSPAGGDPERLKAFNVSRH